ncbi:hypothetical protein N5079_12000 [Planotetraspora sp. A-T 1434]|uniref:hypothetical protein n=1 Tax=Planotetraspora sp. A-T 1434 TaxID=2979219 RepID=UPI0021C0E319|nr:hypothetical protein [Planotetraspora sp. A-T 1434]MCT9930942.1 hypothetical protein [Planotetraspora sp. A-T 1434]
MPQAGGPVGAGGDAGRDRTVSARMPPQDAAASFERGVWWEAFPITEEAASQAISRRLGASEPPL